MALNRSLLGRWSAVPLMAIAAALQLCVSRRRHELHLRHRPRAVGDWPAGSGCASAPGHCASYGDGLRRRPVLLPSVCCRAIRHRILLAHELWRLYQSSDRPIGRRLAEFVSGGLPFLPVLPLLLGQSDLHLVSDVSWEPRGKIDGLMYVIELYSDIVAFVIAATSWARSPGLPSRPAASAIRWSGCCCWSARRLPGAAAHHVRHLHDRSAPADSTGIDADRLRGREACSIAWCGARSLPCC